MKHKESCNRTTDSIKQIGVAKETEIVGTVLGDAFLTNRVHLTIASQIPGTMLLFPYQMLFL